MHVRRQHRRELLVPRQLVGQVGDIGLPGADALEEVERLLQRGMRMVVADLHAAQRDVLHAAQLLELRLAVQHLDVGQVGDVAEAVAQHGGLLLAVVPAVDGNHLHGAVGRRMRRQVVVAEAVLPGEDVLVGVGMHRERGRRRVDQVHAPLRRAGILLLREGVAVLAAERRLHVGLAENVDGMGLRQVEGADVVQPARMVLMVVRQQDGIQMVHVVQQHLGAEIRPGIHQDGQTAVFDQHGGPQALVARIRRAADLAVAGDHRDAGRGARAEKCQFRFLFHVQSITMSTSVFTSAGS